MKKKVSIPRLIAVLLFRILSLKDSKQADTLYKYDFE